MKTSRRMQSSDLSHVIIELSKKWATGVYGNHLTWSALENQFGFTRQTLQSKPNIKAAYDYAKKALSKGLVGARDENSALTLRIAELEARVKFYEHQEELWRKRWQQIAFNLRLHGESFSSHDKKTKIQLHFSNSVADKIIAPFDKPIPPSGRV